MKLFNVLILLSLMTAPLCSAAQVLQTDTLPAAIVYSFNGHELEKNTAASVTVLQKNDFTRFNSQSAVQAFNNIPGVKMDERSPGSYRLSIRGNLVRSTFGVRNVKFYWNDVPYTDAGGNTYLNALSPYLLQRAEIVRGPSGSMYGNGTGGLVLLNNGKPATNQKSELFVSGGSYDEFNVGGTYSAGKEKRLHSLKAVHQQANGYRDHSSFRRENILYSGTFNCKNQEVTVNAFGADLYYETPGGLTPAEYAANPHAARPAAGGFPSAAVQKAAIHLSLLYFNIADKIDLGSGWTNMTGIYSSADRQRNPAIRNFEDKQEIGSGARTSFNFEKNNFRFSIGGEFQYSRVNTSTYGNRRGTKDSLQYRDIIIAKQLNIFFQGEVTLPANFSLTAGISRNNYAYNFDRKNIPGSADDASFKPEIIPRITLLNKINGSISVYGSFSRGYSPPSIDEIHASDGKFNKAISAERGTNYEAGVKALLLRNRISLSAAYYFFDLKNTIVSRRDASGADFYVNAGSTDQKGLEGFAEYRSRRKDSAFFKTFSSFISITGTDAHFKNYKQGANDFSGHRLTGTPFTVLSAGISLTFINEIYTACSATYTGRIPVNDANSFYATGYTIIYGRVGKKVSLKKCIADFYVSAQQSANEPYSLGNDLNAAGNRFYNAAAPFKFSVGANLQF